MSKITTSAKSTNLIIPTVLGTPQVNLALGDNMVLMKSLKDNSVSCIVQDEPYGFNEKHRVDINAFMHATLKNKDYQRAGTGIDGAKWDCDVPPLSTRHEQFRILVPGGHLISFTGNQNLHLVMTTLEKAGFQIIDLLVWVHGNGVPKYPNVDDKLSSDPSNSRFMGARKYLSPSMEVMVLAKKPTIEKTELGNQILHGSGLLNVKQCRFDGTSQNMYPKNVIIQNIDDVINHAGNMAKRFYRVDKSSFDLEIVQSFFVNRSNKRDKEMGLENENIPYTKKHMYSDKIVETKNPHKTVKPVELMRYLVKMVSFEGDTVLDAYAGSGSTGVACMLENRKFIGAELEPDYFETARLRISNVYRENQSKILTSNRDELIWTYDKLLRNATTDIEKQKLLNEVKLKMGIINNKLTGLKKAA